MGVPKKGGFPQKRGVSNPGGNYDFGEIFTLNLIKQNVRHFSLIFLTQNFLLWPWKTLISITTTRYCKFLQIVSTVIYQIKVPHQCLPLRFCLFPSLICSPWCDMQLLDVISQRRYFYSSKLGFIGSKGGANSEDLNALGFFF